ncbi:MAG: deoxyribodipyrimidine photolyase [Acidobacteria bacterium]|nr:deoxyribodipyrimidine photolyase [Acidobacteriota bacterium]
MRISKILYRARWIRHRSYLIHPLRIRQRNAAQPRAGASYVLYWVQMNRRAVSNHALAYAIERANELGLPLLVYEALTFDYPEANDRIHTFILEGVPEMQRQVEALGAGYCFYLRRSKSDSNRVLYDLAKDAALVVTDDYPVFVAATHNERVAGKIDVPFYTVDSSCIVPMNAFGKREWAAYTIRPKIQKLLFEYLEPVPKVRLRHRWTAPKPEWHTEVSDIAKLVASCAINHSVKPSISFTGGAIAARKHLDQFIASRIARYSTDRNSPSNHATSELSPYLHFGQIAAVDVALAAKSNPEFLEELIVRRELAFNFARHCPNPGSLEALPDWAQLTLRKHAADHRDYVYSPDQFEHAQTPDALWNACQKEMLLRGRIHGYYRMYWGKKIIEWSPTHQQAQDTMLAIHDRYALDGRDPNTYTSVLWCFGLHDRPWGERPVFGTVRYMGLEGMKRKTDVPSYIKEIEYLERTGKDPFRI